MDTQIQRAPSPKGGMLGGLYNILEDMGDWTSTTDICNLSDIEPITGYTKRQRTSKNLENGVYRGYFVKKNKGGGTYYKIAPLTYYNNRIEPLRIKEQAYADKKKASQRKTVVNFPVPNTASKKHEVKHSSTPDVPRGTSSGLAKINTVLLTVIAAAVSAHVILDVLL